jgi:tripartite-type tricarboxylate transporter receptor subunit TctC
MTRMFGQQVLIENIASASGTLAAARAPKAEPDGYTLMLHHIGPATSVGPYRKLNYDQETSFDPIRLVTDAPMKWSVRPISRPARSASYSIIFGPTRKMLRLPMAASAPSRTCVA